MLSFGILAAIQAKPPTWIEGTLPILPIIPKVRVITPAQNTPKWAVMASWVVESCF